MPDVVAELRYRVEPDELALAVLDHHPRSRLPFGGRRRFLALQRRMIELVPSFTEPTALRIEPAGLRFRTPTGESWRTWPHYQTVVDCELGIVLIMRGPLGGSGVILIPSRAFQPGQQATVASYIKERVPPPDEGSPP